MSIVRENWNTEHFILNDGLYDHHHCSYCGKEIKEHTEYEEYQIQGRYYFCDCSGALKDVEFQQDAELLEKELEELKEKAKKENPIDREMVDRVTYEHALQKLKKKHNQK